MKKIIKKMSVALIAIVLFASCSKDEAAVTPAAVDPIVGTWKLTGRITRDGTGPVQSTTFTPCGSNNIYVFTAPNVASYTYGQTNSSNVCNRITNNGTWVKGSGSNYSFTDSYGAFSRMISFNGTTSFLAQYSDGSIVIVETFTRQ